MLKGEEKREREREIENKTAKIRCGIIVGVFIICLFSKTHSFIFFAKKNKKDSYFSRKFLHVSRVASTPGAYLFFSLNFLAGSNQPELFNALHFSSWSDRHAAKSLTRVMEMPIESCTCLASSIDRQACTHKQFAVVTCDNGVDRSYDRRRAVASSSP